MDYIVTRSCSCGFCGPTTWSFWVDEGGIVGHALPAHPHGDHVAEPLSVWDLVGELAMCPVSGESVAVASLVPA